MNEEKKYEIQQREPVGLQMTVTFEQSKTQLKNLQGFIAEVMVEGEDYGRVEGIDKPFLFKSGAEKLAEIYGLAIMPPETTHRVEDWDVGFFHYEVRITLTNKRTGMVVAGGVGSCNSKEKRYRNRDVFSIVNTILKMAKKRALVDAVLSATRSSAIFTQDEDTVDTTLVSPANRTTSAPETQKPQSSPAVKEIFKMASQIGQFQSVDSEGAIILDSYNQPKINFTALGHFFKEKGMSAGNVKEMTPDQLTQAKVELEKLQGGQA